MLAGSPCLLSYMPLFGAISLLSGYRYCPSTCLDYPTTRVNGPSDSAQRIGAVYALEQPVGPEFTVYDSATFPSELAFVSSCLAEVTLVAVGISHSEPKTGALFLEVLIIVTTVDGDAQKTLSRHSTAVYLTANRMPAFGTPRAVIIAALPPYPPICQESSRWHSKR